MPKFEDFTKEQIQEVIKYHDDLRKQIDSVNDYLCNNLYEGATPKELDAEYNSIDDLLSKAAKVAKSISEKLKGD